MAENTIKFALYLESWNYATGDQEYLKKQASRKMASEFDISMKDQIFCPQCCTPLSRKPLNKDTFTNGRKAFFAHLPSYKEINCDLRAPEVQGKKYNSEEEAKKAIDNESLAIIWGFKSEQPPQKENVEEEYDQTAIEDEDGPVSDIPISRHRGETFKLPTKITTVAGICRNFDKNFYKYFYLPDSNIALPLNRILHNVEDITGEDDKPKLYYGLIRVSKAQGKGLDSNMRFTFLKFSHPNYKDFNLKDVNSIQKRHGISDNSEDRIVIFWGGITESGIGLCVKNLKWGEYGLLPKKYNSILID